MHKFKSLFILAACASFASATAVQRWTSSTVDTTTAHANTNAGSNKVAVGATVTGTGGVGVGALSTGTNGFGVKGVSSGSWGIGVWGEGANHGVIGLSGNSGVQGNTYGAGGKGVAGYVEANVQATGVFGQARSGYGVHGVVNGISPTGSEFVGVFGQATGNNGTGVRGQGHGSGYGVLGAAQVGATGVYGTVPNDGIGVHGYVGYSSGAPSMGLLGEVPGGWDNYGVYGYASSYNSVGVYGEAQGHFALAGSFAGDVYATGDIHADGVVTWSDAKFKKNIAPLQGAMETVMSLKPKVYEMKTEEFKDHMSFTEGRRFGLIAQELETVLPELVNNSFAPAKVSVEDRKKGVSKPPLEYKSVNYTALIPVLIAALQELQAEVDALKAGR